RPRASEDAPRHVAQPSRSGQQRHDRVGGQAVAERTLAGPSLESGWQSREHRGMAEELALPEDVEHATVADELHGAPAHDSHVVHWALALPEDRRARGEELDLRRAGESLERPVGQIVEGSVAVKEFDYVVHAWTRAVSC